MHLAALVAAGTASPVHREASFVVNKPWAALIAVGALVALTALAHVLIVRNSTPAGQNDPVATRRRGIKALVIGADGRASTSKLQPVLWLYALFFAFIFLFAWGRSTNCGAAHVDQKAGCTEAKQARDSFQKVIDAPLQSEYFVLLGFPLTAAIAAKALVTNKVASGDLTKPAIAAGASPPPDANASQPASAAAPPATTAGGLAPSTSTTAGAPSAQPPKGIADGLAEVISNDRGETDLLDFQYFAFNLLTLTYFALQFITKPSAGLPDLPATLIALSGISVAAYTTKKALESDVRASISDVLPKPFPAATGTMLQILGRGFGPAAKASDPPTTATTRRVLLNGSDLNIVSWSDNALKVTITDPAVAAVGAQDPPTIVVIDSVGVATEPFPVQVS